MSTYAASASPLTMASHASTPASGTALLVGLAGIAVAAAGLFVSVQQVAISWLIAITFWTAVSLGALFLVMIHYIVDASWSVILRRQYEHWLSSFTWLAVLFLPLLAVAWLNPTMIWKWMDPSYDLSAIGGHGTVGQDVLWVKKSGFLNRNLFTVFSLGSFAAWIGLSSIFRRNSFTQDSDGDARWTFSSRKWSAGGIPLAAVTLTGCIIFLVKSTEYHWFSTMYPVWFFANCVRVALSLGVILMVWLWRRGDFKGILNDNHMHSIGQLMFAFTVFWAYVTFSQYFLIWNANVPEETFWYNVRENGQWFYVGMFLLFGHFFVPFLTLILYPVKVNRRFMPYVSWWIAIVVMVDVCYNVLPATSKTAAGDPLPFLSINLVWTFAALVGVGGICLWSYLRSFPTTKLIPIRDPRIGECLTYHQPHAD